MDYKTASNKIFDAYFKGKIRPFHPQFCFCGTLCNSQKWFNPNARAKKLHPSHFSYAEYSGREYFEMESALFSKLEIDGYTLYEYDEGYEDALFEGMCAALEVLKEIHRKRGENVDEIPLTKRKLESNLI